MFRLIALTTLSILLPSLALAAPATTQKSAPEKPQELYDRVSPSLVAVQYTIEGEYGRREFVGAGVIVREDGLVMVPLAFVPLQIPDAQMKGFKIILPADEEQTFDAIFLGRDERSDVGFVKAKTPQKWPAIKFEDRPLQVGDTVVSIGLLPKHAGYKSYYTRSTISALLRGPIPHILVDGGLAAVGSPVFNTEGKAIGWVPFQQDQIVVLSNLDPKIPLPAVQNPPMFLLPARDFLLSLADPPTETRPIQVPWLGAAMTGLKKDVAEYFNLKGQQVAQIGDVVADSPAGRAGLQAGDKIVKLDGQALERGDEPEETPAILIRKIRRMKVGQKITLTVLREKGKPTTDIVVTLDAQPRQANLAQRYYADDLGFSVREIVFADLYAKHLPPDTKGVIVSYIRPSSSAASAKLNPNDLVTELDHTPVTDLGQFQKLYQQFRKEKATEAIVVAVIRDGNTQVIRIEPPQ